MLDTLSPGIDVQRGTVEAKLSVAAPPPFLRSDMTVSIDIAVARQGERAGRAGRGAARPAAPEPSVLVIRGGVATRAGVRTGARTAEQVEILDGLKSGEPVVVVPAVVAPRPRSPRALTRER